MVLKLQERIREAHARLTKDGRQGQIIIFGKIGHAEVLGLVGQVGGDATVIEDLAMLEEKINDGTISLTVPTEVFSQTTKDPQEYESVCRAILEKMEDKDSLFIFDTICRQVAGRHANLARFAVNHDFILFVSGPDSSNGIL